MHTKCIQLPLLIATLSVRLSFHLWNGQPYFTVFYGNRSTYLRGGLLLFYRQTNFLDTSCNYIDTYGNGEEHSKQLFVGQCQKELILYDENFNQIDKFDNVAFGYETKQHVSYLPFSKRVEINKKSGRYVIEEIETLPNFYLNMIE